jgi:hypothetical protein
MSTQVQYRRGSNVQVAAFTGALGEIVVDTTNKILVVNDGITVGGFPQVGLSATQTLTNKTLNNVVVSGTVTGNIVPDANVTYNLGSITNNYSNVYVDNIKLGNLSLESTSNTTATLFYSLGTGNLVVGNLYGNLVNGTTSFGINSANGNAELTVGSTSNVVVFASTGQYTTGVISASGNITGSYILGNGSQLTGIDATSIQSGTSNVRVVSSGGNVAVGIGGTANVAVFATTGEYVTGEISATGNITGGNLRTAGLISATSTITSAANITGGNILTGGVVSATGNINSGANIVATANVIGGNVTTGGIISATGNITGGNLAGTNITGTIATAAQTNITSVGTLTSLAVTGNISPGGLSMPAGNAIIGNLYVNGNTTIAGNITQISGNSGQFFGNATTGFNALYAGLPAGFTILPQSVVNYVSTFNGYSQINNQNQNGGNESTTDYILTANNGNDSTYFMDMGIAGSGYDGTVAILNNALGNSVEPNDGYIYVTGNVAGGQIANLVIGTPDPGSSVEFIVGGSTTANIAARIQTPNTVATSTTTGAFVVVGGVGISGNVYAGGNLNITGNIVDGGALSIITGSNGNISLLPNGTGIVTVSSALSATGNITGSNLSVGTGAVTLGNIVNANGNGVGNIGAVGGYFNTIFAKSTSAQYADLAEMYVADMHYGPATVVEFGGDYEVTASKDSHSTSVAGIVSTNPSYLMNSAQTGEYVVAVALVGRVPCNVVGKINKGDRLVASNIPGVATRLVADEFQPGCIIGKALDPYDSNEVGTIEVAVGRT